MNVNNENKIGKAGEFLACCDLTLKGFAVFMNERQISYDLVVDTGEKLLRIQVKTCEKPRTNPASKMFNAYVYNPRCYGIGGRKKYDISDVDVFAFVALDIMKVAYIKSEDVRQIMLLHPETSRGKFRYEEINMAHEDVLALKGKFTQKEIAEKLHLSETTVSKMIRGKHKQPSSQVRYFLDFCRDREWFLNL